jgi:hypothetical protein
MGSSYCARSPSIWRVKPDCVDSLNRIEVCLQLIIKARGHINAIEKKIWNDRARGIWSAKQARARLAQVLQGLQSSSFETIKINGYISKEQLSEYASLLDELAPECQSLSEVYIAEESIEQRPFPSLRERHHSKDFQNQLTEGLNRQWNYINSLNRLLEFTENAVAQQFLALRTGDWIVLPNAAQGVICSVRGLTAQVFVPSNAVGDLLNAMHLYYLPHARIGITKPQYMEHVSPAHYWLAYADERVQLVRYMLQRTHELRLTRDVLIQALDAAAKCWWIINSPSESQVSWTHCQLRNVQLIRKESSLPESILIGAAGRIEYLSGWSPTRLVEPDKSWELQFAVMAEGIARVLNEMKEQLATLVASQQ